MHTTQNKCHIIYQYWQKIKINIFKLQKKKTTKILKRSKLVKKKSNLKKSC